MGGCYKRHFPPFLVIFNDDLLTSHNHFGQRLAGADVVGGHAFVGSAVAGFEAGDHQISSLGGLRPCGQTRSAHAAPLKLDGVAAVGQALQSQGVSGPELHLVGQGGGVRGTCVRGTAVVFKVIGGRPTPGPGPLTLHLHLRVRLAVAVLVGGVADVLSRILPPDAGQSQDPIVHRVFPRQRGPEFGPGDDGRRGAWESKERKRRQRRRHGKYHPPGVEGTILPLAWHAIVTVCPSTTVISVALTEATGAPGPPSTKSSTLISAIPSLFSALQI